MVVAQGRVPENPETVVNEATLPILEWKIAFLQLLPSLLSDISRWETLV